METKNGSGDKTLDNLVIIMAIVLFFGTAQVMSTHSPALLNDILGFDASYIFGAISATCVEVGALRLHFNPYAKKNATAQWVKWILLAVSGLCQIYNAAIETGTLAELSETLKIGFTWLVPNIPLLFIVLNFWIGRLTDEAQPFKGIKNMLPDWHTLWEGEGQNDNVLTPENDALQPEPRKSKKKVETPNANFTEGERR